MAVEKIEKEGVLYAIIAHQDDLNGEKSAYLTPNEEPLQIGTTANKAGYVERIHYHRDNPRTVKGAHQMLYVIKGKAAMDFYDSDKKLFKTVELNVGDLMLIVDGIHRIRMLTDFCAISAKEGPYISAEQDKVDME